ncbi:UDP-2,4-diacetamido-2,4,6-trideoxy-beta-L-altropyranose hydrolase [Rhodovulum euryhalinum]|uniref:UDP-2,4-diacetamido-2,4, 6-trideoxy-beta-L-altropyranose hydrolase n=1 Tax=Rhodovulum euryhalinum TaxID=35805 RepID=A0A4R2KDQ2_9RHOB|nr:UDP-2,4-diacetamido-2,4,6-trideoxy-beta-L-altropyranose hydrolase [Rhodovulum euryhalinum]TCO71633.1 UDP-2,4-diacetamido-2,4,6-trideoxy-beta-L-altropyranose hydrolase [Rhodovulum euryhalinum]
MRVLIRADGGQLIGGGHLMRCLTLAGAAAARGHQVLFAAARSDLNQRIAAAGFPLVELAPLPHTPESAPPHAPWLSLPWDEDARLCADLVAAHGVDWVILDHYGLDSRWSERVRKARPGLRLLVLDDLDDRPLGADLLLDAGRFGGPPRRHPVPGTLTGPAFALLRPEFAARRAEALARRGGEVRRVLILPGLMDAAGLAPLALDALAGSGLEAEVVMGATAQSLAEVRRRVAGRAGRSLTLDATDMADRMLRADLCIGAGGGTAWERCCLGLPTVAVAVAENQVAWIDALAARGAVEPLSLAEARAGGLRGALEATIARAPAMARAAAALCDGQGAARVLDAIEARLRPLESSDMQRLFDWRNQPHIRAASHDPAPLDPATHAAWFAQSLSRKDGLWRIYREGGRDLGVVSAVDRGEGRWQWSFHVGEPDAPPGAGGRMLAAFLRLLADTPGCRWLEGEVIEGNDPSAALHRRLGFRQVATGQPGILVFRREVCHDQTIDHGA